MANWHFAILTMWPALTSLVRVPPTCCMCWPPPTENNNDIHINRDVVGYISELSMHWKVDGVTPNRTAEQKLLPTERCDEANFSQASWATVTCLGLALTSTLIVIYGNLVDCCLIPEYLLSLTVCIREPFWMHLADVLGVSTSMLLTSSP